MIGHGTSVPNNNAELPHRVTVDRQVECILKLLQQENVLKAATTSQHPKCLVPIGRSYGANVVCHLMSTNEVADVTKAAVLIAPAGAKCAHPSTPVLCVWARDDTIIRFNPTQVTSVFKHVTPLYFDKVIVGDLPAHQSHMPEILKQKEFQEALEKFLKDNRVHDNL